MKITNLKTNRISNPLGFDLTNTILSFVTSETNGTKQVAAQIQVSYDEEFDDIVFDSKKSEDIDSVAFKLSLALKAYTRYYWRVTVWADNGDVSTSDVAWFETAKMNESWTAKWITPDFESNVHPILSKGFNIEKPIKSARAYVCGLGLYEININGEKCGDEYLAPNFNSYDKWIQYQTYDITDSLVKGENEVEVLLGNGMYKGRFGFDSKDDIYGDKFSLLCELVINFEDGTSLLINTDESWKARKSKVLDSNIYDGEVYDSTFNNLTTYEVREIEIGFDRLKARLSLPVKIKERLNSIEVIKTPAGETVLDLGQNMVGWIEFKTNSPKGTEIKLQYGEILQDGNFYRDNLRSAKAEYIYIANGEETVVRPYFTYYGFRYVKISGLDDELNIKDFTGCVLYSDMELTGHIETSNPLVNKLFLNALWGQKGNFLDVPTDCPQRDERMGWTGDAQVFSRTASFNMDTFAFFRKYLCDIGYEQEDRGGMVPMVVPSAGVFAGGSSVWGDVATIVPWNLYIQYGDKSILQLQFESMKAWVDYIKKADDESGAKRLWITGMHLGDWLALDGDNPQNPVGGTDSFFIASAYYFYSSMIVAKAARVLGKEEVAEQYEKLANEVKEAIRDEYFSKNGRITVNTQTALVLSLYMDLIPESLRTRLANDLREKLKKDNNHLKTGFVGTPLLCGVLSESGCNDLAYTLLLNKDYPSWLYSVTMGATTIWERWNSVLPDGKISPEGMNSLNHYAYGSIVEWMYRYMVGINPVEDNPGFKHIKLTPKPDYRLKYAKGSYNSPVGLIQSQWEMDEDEVLKFIFLIPFNVSASLILPHANIENIKVNSKRLKETLLEAKQYGDNVSVELTSGLWEFNYAPEISYFKYYSVDNTYAELVENNETKNILVNGLDKLLTDDMKVTFGHLSLRELSKTQFLPIAEDILGELNKKLNKFKVIA